MMDEPTPEQRAEDVKVADFLRELTELSIKHRLGIAGPFDLFKMDHYDFDRTYRDNQRGKFEFF